MPKLLLLTAALALALVGFVHAASHGSVVASGGSCTYGLIFNQGCNTAILAMGQNQ